MESFEVRPGKVVAEQMFWTRPLDVNETPEGKLI